MNIKTTKIHVYVGCKCVGSVGVQKQNEDTIVWSKPQETRREITQFCEYHRSLFLICFLFFVCFSFVCLFV